MEDSATRKLQRCPTAEWRTIMARYEESGLSGKGFREAEGIGKSAFWRWRPANGDAGGGKAVFVQLAGGSASSWDAELDLGAGVVLRVRRRAVERRIWLCVAAADMRRSFDGLTALAHNHLGEDPADGSWFVFVNRRRTIVKVLSFDGGGYWVWA